MSYTVSIHKDNLLSARVKYRDSFDAPAIMTTTNVNIGNFASKNLFCDNSVEVGCGYIGQTPGPIIEPIVVPSYDAAASANYIKIVWSDYVVIGHITDWEYVNDNNTRISYQVDAYMSARESGMITKAEGICERTNLTYNNKYFVNMQPEPLSPSDITRFSPEVSESFNNAINGFEGVTPQSAGVANSGMKIVLTVSPAICQFMGITTPFTTPGAVTPTLKNVSSLNFQGNDTTPHCGGTFRGTPLLFPSVGAAQTFIKGILGGCGFRVVHSSNGHTTQQAVTHRGQHYYSDVGGGQQNQYHRNWNNDPIESLRFITGADIYNLYAIPSAFATDRNSYFETDISVTNFKIPFNMHQFGEEKHNKNKLLAYPYKYYKFVTANGDSMSIFPQTHFQDAGDFNYTVKVECCLRFIGGDTPRLMAKLVPGKDRASAKYNLSASNEWFTVRNYPAVTLSYNDSYNPQVQRDIGNARKVAAMYANSVANSSLNSPLKQGYRDMVRGELSFNENRGLWDGLKSLGGYALGAPGALINAVSGTTGVGIQANMFSDLDTQAAQNERRSIAAGNFVSPEIGVVMGNDFASQLGVQAVAVYECGATDAELFTFCRYFEEYGQACNCRLNPISNEGDLFAGYAGVWAYDIGDGTVGRTYYQFSNITIEGYLPYDWRANIKSLFETGVHLIDNT